MRRVGTVILAGVAFTALAAFLLAHYGAGTEVRTRVVGLNATRLAVDSHTGRTFVLDQGSLGRDSGGGIVAGTIHMLDTRTGMVVRTVPAGTAPVDLAVDEQTGRVFVLSSFAHNGGQGMVTVLDARSGQIIRVTPVGDLPMALALDAGAGRVFVLNVPNGVHVLHTHYAQLSVLDASSGRLIGGFTPDPRAGPGDGALSLALDARRHRLWLPVSEPHGRMAIRVFDTRTDALVQRIPLGATNAATIIASQATGRTFVFLDTHVLMLDTATGHIVRVLPHAIYGQPLVDERTRRVFLIEQNWSAVQNAPNWGRTATGWLHILDAGTGALLRTMSIASPDGWAVDERTGRLLISHAGEKLSDSEFAGAGQVDVRDGVTGRLLRTLPVGVDPVVIAVDDRTRQALVLSEGGRIPTRDPWGWLPEWLRRHAPVPAAPPDFTSSVPSSVSLFAP